MIDKKRHDIRVGFYGYYVEITIPLFFHKYATHRKNINSIWKIKDDSGNLVEGSEAIVEVGIQHFESLF